MEDKPRRFFFWNEDVLKRQIKWGEVAFIIFSLFILFSILIPPCLWHHDKGKSRRTTCVSNIRQLSMAVFIHAEDYGVMPGIVNDGKEYVGWAYILLPYINSNSDVTKPMELFFCPEIKSEVTTPVSYGYNSALLQPNGKGIKSKKIIKPELIGVICDAELLTGSETQGGIIGDKAQKFSVKNKNASKLFVKPVGRHIVKKVVSVVVGYADGHAKAVEGNYIDSDKENGVNKAFYRAVELGYIKKEAKGK